MNNSVHVNNLSLTYAAVLVIVALIISNRQKLKLESDMIVSVIRAIVQLILAKIFWNEIFFSDKISMLKPPLCLIIVHLEGSFHENPVLSASIAFLTRLNLQFTSKLEI